MYQPNNTAIPATEIVAVKMGTKVGATVLLERREEPLLVGGLEVGNLSLGFRSMR